MFYTICIDILHLNIYGIFVALYIGGIIVIPVANTMISDGIFDYLEKKGRSYPVVKAIFRPALSALICAGWLSCIWKGCEHFGNVAIVPILYLAMYLLQMILGTEVFKAIVEKTRTPKAEKKKAPKRIKVKDFDEAGNLKGWHYEYEEL